MLGVSEDAVLKTLRSLAKEKVGGFGSSGLGGMCQGLMLRGPGFCDSQPYARRLQNGPRVKCPNWGVLLATTPAGASDDDLQESRSSGGEPGFRDVLKG